MESADWVWRKPAHSLAQSEQEPRWAATLLHLEPGKTAVKVLAESCLHITAAVHLASSPRGVSERVVEQGRGGW